MEVITKVQGRGIRALTRAELKWKMELTVTGSFVDKKAVVLVLAHIIDNLLEQEK